MAITAQRLFDTVGDPQILAGKAAAEKTHVKGALCVIDGGYISLPTDAANKVPAGVLINVDGMGPGDETITPGSASTPDCAVARGRIWVPFTGAAQTDVGLLFYLFDNGTVTKTAGSKTWSLMCVGVKNDCVLLDFNSLHGAAA
jgi:hypothetical protein